MQMQGLADAPRVDYVILQRPQPAEHGETEADETAFPAHS
jgi:hypothetical protein